VSQAGRIEDLSEHTTEVCKLLIMAFMPAISAADRLIEALRLFKDGKLQRSATWILVFETIQAEEISEAALVESEGRGYELRWECSLSLMSALPI